MEYTIKQLAQMAGVTTRTLRHYDDIGLLVPRRKHGNAYRVYGSDEVDQLQQILFYRELGMPLEEIRQVMASKDFDDAAALASHLTALLMRKQHLDRLIQTVRKTLAARKGEIRMDDHEKFAGLKEKLMADNEAAFGEEVRARYGEEAVRASNARFAGMTQAEFDEMAAIESELRLALRVAVPKGDPAGAEGQAIADLHRRWLGCSWDTYSKEAHIGVTQMYVDDERFAQYYDAMTPGAATYLRDAVAVYCA